MPNVLIITTLSKISTQLIFKTLVVIAVCRPTTILTHRGNGYDDSQPTSVQTMSSWLVAY